MVDGLLADANTMVMVVPTTSLWLTRGDGTCSKATEHLDKVATELDKEACLSN